MKIKFATLKQDFAYLKANDRLITPEIARQKIEQGDILIIKDGEKTVGWLRFGLIWTHLRL